VALYAVVPLRYGRVPLGATVQIVTADGTEVISGPVPDNGRSGSDDHRIHRAISNLGLHLRDGSLDAARCPSTPGTARFEVIAPSGDGREVRQAAEVER
jgi:hypothetical protein